MDEYMQTISPQDINNSRFIAQVRTRGIDWRSVK